MRIGVHHVRSNRQPIHVGTAYTVDAYIIYYPITSSSITVLAYSIQIYSHSSPSAFLCVYSEIQSVRQGMHENERADEFDYVMLRVWVNIHIQRERQRPHFKCGSSMCYIASKYTIYSSIIIWHAHTNIVDLCMSAVPMAISRWTHECASVCLWCACVDYIYDTHNTHVAHHSNQLNICRVACDSKRSSRSRRPIAHTQIHVIHPSCMHRGYSSNMGARGRMLHNNSAEKIL